MCTVTVVPGGGRDRDAPRGGPDLVLRLVCNRDEQRMRAPALPPVRRMVGGRAAIMPVDPVSDGTWIGANDAGFLICLLNAGSPGAAGQAQGRPESGPRRSRGEIVPMLLGCQSVREALDLGVSVDPSLYPPFSLVMVEEGRIAVLGSDGKNLGVAQHGRPDRPVMFTSSSLGEQVAEPVRRALFSEMMDAADDWLEVQQRFQSHTWPDRTHVSVLMSRPDARTVSQTTVELRRQSVWMAYSVVAEPGLVQPLAGRVELPIQRMRAAG